MVVLKIFRDNIPVGNNVNVAFAASVTTQARLKLYEYLSKMRESVLYCDTDSVIFIQKDNYPPNLKTGNSPRDLTDEL